MAWTKMTESSKTVDSPVTYDTENNLITDAKDSYDVFTAKHTASGTHNDDLIPRGRGRITYSGSTPTLAQSWGVVSGVAATTNGVRVTISTPSTNTTGIHVSVTSTDTGAAESTVQVSIVDTSHFDIFFASVGDTTYVYPATLTFAVWTD